MLALFPGQGSQFVGMSKELFNEFKIAKEVFEEASDASGLHIKKLCFDGPESDLTLTENTQPCLLTASIAAFRVAQNEKGFTPTLVAGHSLGEYSALVAAGALPLSAAVKWVRARGASMQEAVPKGQGTMAAVLNLEDAQVEALCKEATVLAKKNRASGAIDSDDYTIDAACEPANYNAPGQLVIAGSTDAVQVAITLIKTSDNYKGGRAILLSVSAPFHSSLMRATREKMAEIFKIANDHEKPKKLLCPYIPNRTGRISNEAGIILELLVEQVDHPVLWKQSAQAFLEKGFESGVEFGPGKVLAGLVKRIAQPLSKTCVIKSCNDVATLKELA